MTTRAPVEHTFKCNNCGKIVIISTLSGATQAVRIAAAVYGWWFELGSDEPVCGGKCAAEWNEKRNILAETEASK